MGSMPSMSAVEQPSALPYEVVKRDQDLGVLVHRGEVAGTELAALRYEWCEVRGWTQRQYAEQVGVSQPAVAKSVMLHKQRHPDLITPVIKSTQRKAAKSREESKRVVRAAERITREAVADVIPLRREQSKPNDGPGRKPGRAARFAQDVGSTAQALLAWKPRKADDVTELRHLADCLRTVEQQAREARERIEGVLGES